MSEETSQTPLSRYAAIQQARSTVQIFQEGTKWKVRRWDEALQSWWIRELGSKKQAQRDVSVFRLKVALSKMGTEATAISEAAAQFKTGKDKWMEYVPKPAPGTEPERDPGPDPEDVVDVPPVIDSKSEPEPEPEPDPVSDPIEGASPEPGSEAPESPSPAEPGEKL